MKENTKKVQVKNNKTRIRIFYVVSVLIIISIIALIVLGIINLVNKNDKNNIGNNIEIADGDSANPYAKPEDMPSIAGDSNTEKINGVKVNNSVALKSDKKVDQYVFSNISLETASGGSVITMKVTAPSATEKIPGKDIAINFYNKDGKLISIMTSYLAQIKPGETFEFRAESTSDLANAYDIKIEIK